MEGLSDVARVIAPDLRGFGNDRRVVPAAMTMEDHAADLIALLDAEDVGRVVLCGLSMGGYVAMAFASRWPERLAGLVLANTLATADDADGRAARGSMAKDAHEKGMAVIARGMVPRLVAEGTFVRKPEVVDRLLKMISRQRPETVAAAARGMALRADRMEALRGLHEPTLVITGAEDRIMPLSTSEAMVAAIPEARLEVIPGAGHLTPMEEPERFNAILRDWFAGHIRA